jgi:alkylation response protein AidB-like acyl-CoA dehydrogenase
MSIDTAVRPTDRTDIAHRVSALAPGFRARIPVTEAGRSVPRESIEELRAAGMARLMVPREHGGTDGHVRDLVEATSAAAYGCPSTGWLAGLMADMPHVVGLFPPAAQAAVWADGPDALVACTVMPSGKAQRVEGGYRLSGRHAFSSGVGNADWVFVGGMVAAPAGPPEWRLFLVDSDHYTVEDVWNTAGMRGTGSNTVVTDDVFVPEDHTISQVEAREGTGPGSLVNADSKFRLPWYGYSILVFTSTMLGATEGAYDSARTTLAAKRTPAGALVADGQILQVQLGIVAAKISTARTLLLAIADRADSGRSYTLEDRATNGRDNAFASILLGEAVDTLLDLSGTGGFADTSPVQQAWRDVHFALAHVSVNKADIFGRYGRIALGVEEKATGGFF